MHIFTPFVHIVDNFRINIEPYYIVNQLSGSYDTDICNYKLIFTSKSVLRFKTSDFRQNVFLQKPPMYNLIFCSYYPKDKKIVYLHPEKIDKITSI